MLESLTAEVTHRLVADRYGLPIVDFSHAIYLIWDGASKHAKNPIVQMTADTGDSGKTTAVEVFWKLDKQFAFWLVAGGRKVVEPYAVPFCTCGDKPWDPALTIRPFESCSRKFRCGGRGDSIHPSNIGRKVMADLIAYRCQVELAKMREDEGTAPAISVDSGAADSGGGDNSKLPRWYSVLAAADDTRPPATGQEHEYRVMAGADDTRPNATARTAVAALWPGMGRAINSLKSTVLFLSSLGSQHSDKGPLSLDPSAFPARRWYSVEHSGGFQFAEEKGVKWGWICDPPCAQGEHVTFSVDYGLYFRYSAGVARRARGSALTARAAAVAAADEGDDEGGAVLTIGFLASYEGMGVFDCRTVCYGPTGEVTEGTVQVDGQWERRASVYSDKRLLAVSGAPGKCNVTVTTRAPVPGRTTGNKVKILAVGVSVAK